MTLDEYRSRRDFARTPEPAGAADPEPAGDAHHGVGGAAHHGGAGSTQDVDPREAVRGRFVVQRHRARRLHYDLRLEVDGALVSWAVPKGPTLDPAARRMAVHVEDHPVEYLDFEGVIPAGQYGSGDVVVWDWGTWEPEEQTPDAAAAVAGGELKFRLKGEKLRGRFLLVRTSDRHADARGGGAGSAASDAPAGSAQPGGSTSREGPGGSTGGQETWLLIHKRDEYAVDEWDPEDHPHSVRSGLTNEDVAANAVAIWVGEAPPDQAEINLSRAVEQPMPRFVEPMRATLASQAFRDDDWLFEVKWDGYRVEAVVRDDGVRLFTRNGNDAGQYFGTLLDPPADWIAADEAIVDGEVVALDADGRPDFGLLQERLGGTRAGHRGLTYQAFDLLYLDGRSLLDVPLTERKKLLHLVLRDGAHVRFAGHVVGEGQAFLAAAAERGLEGVVAKLRSSRYEPGVRGSTWLKVKLRPEQELVVGGWTPRRDAAWELGALVVGVYEDDQLRFVGKVGSGFSARAARTLQEQLADLATAESPFDTLPKTGRGGRWGGDLAGAVWVRPEVVIRAEFGGWTLDGMVRQGSFKGLERERDPREVVREVPVDVPDPVPASPAQPPGPPAPTEPRTDGVGRVTPEELQALADMGPAGTWQVGGQALKLTNLDKVLFPAREGSTGGPITKHELVDYFARVSHVMLPHLVGRPLNLHRFPNGADAPGFWQKDMPAWTPGWLTIWHEAGFGERGEGAEGGRVDPGGSGRAGLGRAGSGRAGNAHVVADSVAALAWLANQAAFEIHAWTSACSDPQHPTFALIDIDPGARTTWEETLTLARLFRTALQHLGVRGYPKTTGSRGIQIWVPVVRGKYDYLQTSTWVETLSRAVAATVPDLVSWRWTKADREGRARLDYTQNAPNRTLVAPYAVRPAPGAPVSMPITWDELDDPELRSDRWTVRNVVPRVAERGDLFALAQSDEQDLPRL